MRFGASYGNQVPLHPVRIASEFGCFGDTIELASKLGKTLRGLAKE